MTDPINNPDTFWYNKIGSISKNDWETMRPLVTAFLPSITNWEPVDWDYWVKINQKHQYEGR